MIEKVEYLEIDRVKYPYICSLNVLEKIQDKYGRLSNWEKAMVLKEEDEETGEISISDLRTTLTFMLNEGAEVEEKEILTEGQVGRLLYKYGIQKAYSIAKDQITICIYGKNA